MNVDEMDVAKAKQFLRKAHQEFSDHQVQAMMEEAGFLVEISYKGEVVRECGYRNEYGFNCSLDEIGPVDPGSRVEVAYDILDIAPSGSRPHEVEDDLGTEAVTPECASYAFKIEEDISDPEVQEKYWNKLEKGY